MHALKRLDTPILFILLFLILLVIYSHVEEHQFTEASLWFLGVAFIAKMIAFARMATTMWPPRDAVETTLARRTRRFFVGVSIQGAGLGILYLIAAYEMRTDEHLFSQEVRSVFRSGVITSICYVVLSGVLLVDALRDRLDISYQEG